MSLVSFNGIIGGIILVCAVYVGYLKIENSHLKEELAVIEAQGKLQKERADNIEEGSKNVAAITTTDFQSKLKELKDYYAKHPSVVRTVDNGVCFNAPSSVPNVPEHPTGTNETTPDTLPPGSSLEGECAETTLQLEELQDLLNKNKDLYNANSR